MLCPLLDTAYIINNQQAYIINNQQVFFLWMKEFGGSPFLKCHVLDVEENETILLLFYSYTGEIYVSS